jgi:glycosyltransferase involved in cell wall biosynthesis
MEEIAMWDSRWRGHHGIARFAAEVHSRLSMNLVSLGETRVRPASLFDPAYIFSQMSAPRRPTLFISPGFNAGLRGNYEQVVTIHDLIHLKVAAERSAAKTLYYSAVVGPVIHRARRVLTVSEFSKREIVDHFRIDPARVEMVGNGSSMEVLTDPVDLGGNVGFVLFVGNSKPHKNLELLIQSAASMDLMVEFVVVGVDQAYVTHLCEAYRVDPRRFTVVNGISDFELQDLYTRAGCVALPSTYEGFGLAAVEAMSRATPTVYCSGAVREVAGETGEYVQDARDGTEYGRALERAIATKAGRFDQLINRAANFSWDRVADRVRSSIWPV